jgi:dihydroneopterin aldolase
LKKENWIRLFSRSRNKTDLRKSCVSDDLNDTVDYVLLNKIVVRKWTYAYLLACRTHHYKDFSEAPEISRILLGVSKLNPPIGGDVESVTIELEEYRT